MNANGTSPVNRTNNPANDDVAYWGAAFTGCQGGAATIAGTDGGQTITGTAGPDVIAGRGGNDTDHRPRRRRHDLRRLRHRYRELRRSRARRGCRHRRRAGRRQLRGRPGAPAFVGAGKVLERRRRVRRRHPARQLVVNVLTGGVGDDLLVGGFGNDTLNGASGDDTLHGNDSTDTLNASTGSDVLVGGEGNDTLTADTGDENAQRRRGQRHPRRGIRLRLDRGRAGDRPGDLCGRATAVTATIGAGADNDGSVDDGPLGFREHAHRDGRESDRRLGNEAHGQRSGQRPRRRPRRDSLFGLSGVDTLNAQDGVADTAIDCGAGTDNPAIVDGIDPRR